MTESEAVWKPCRHMPVAAFGARSALKSMSAQARSRAWRTATVRGRHVAPAASTRCARRRTRFMADAFTDGGARMARRDSRRRRHQHAARPCRQRSARLFRLRQSAGRACLDRAFPDAATMAARAQKYTYGTRGTPTTDALATAIDELEGSAGTILVPSGLAAVDHPAARLPVGRRPRADRRFGLPSDPQFRRHDAEAARRRGRVLRSRMSAPASPR